MKADCHMHMILDGYDWRQAIHRHDPQPDDAFIHRMLALWQEKGYTYLRDGGDRWRAGARARELAPEYGITYVTPVPGRSLWRFYWKNLPHHEGIRRFGSGAKSRGCGFY